MNVSEKKSLHANKKVEQGEELSDSSKSHLGNLLSNGKETN